MKIADSSNDKVILIVIPNNCDCNNSPENHWGPVSDQVARIIIRFIMQVLKIPKKNPITAVFLFLVKKYTDIAAINPIIIRGKKIGIIKKARKIGIIE